jgi:hypothetical protein
VKLTRVSDMRDVLNPPDHEHEHEHSAALARFWA